jgi:hypothetical protein
MLSLISELSQWSSLAAEPSQQFYLRPKTVKQLEENVGEKLYNIGVSDDFLDLTSQVQATKTDMGSH